MGARAYQSDTMDGILRDMEGAFAAKVAIRYYDEEKQAVQEILYRQYAQDIRKMVSYLRAAVPQIEQGKRIALLGMSSYHYAVAMFGVVLAGGVVVPLNLQNGIDELRYELDLVETAAILHDGIYLQREPALAESYGDKLLALSGYQAEQPAANICECKDRDALMAVMFTSGTTGRSKGVMISQKNMFAPAEACAAPVLAGMKALGLPEGYQLSSYSVLPMFHIAAFTSQISWAAAGFAVNVGLDIRNFYRDLAVMPSDAMAVVPVLLDSIHHDVMRGRADRIGKLKILTCGAAMFDPQKLLDLEQHGMIIMQMYGLTETCGDGTWNTEQGEKHIRSVGIGDPKCEYKIDGGELCIRGDCVMLGYYNDPAATAEVIDAEGWFHTGDLVRVDEDGYYYITGRKKNLIILDSGENISPEELEGLLGKNADIKECLVKEKGNKICAVIYADGDKQEAIRQYITETNRTLPLYKRITAVEFTAEPLPRNATGKIERK